MTKNTLLDYLTCGREIEFKFNDKMYSITQGVLDGKHVLSFCEFNQETTEVENPEDVLAIERNGVSVLTMIESISDDDIWIY